MAGDWIKMRMDLQTHPKVVRMMSALKADKLRVIGGLHAVWCIFDSHSADGYLEGYTLDAMDSMIGWPGFSKAMVDIEWLIDCGPHGLDMPRFDEHNGKSAKRRAMETERKRNARSEEKDPEDCGKPSASDADKKRSREEKRRSKNKPPIPPKGGEDPLPPKRSAIALKTYLEECKASGEKPVPDSDAVFEYAEKAGIPGDFLWLQWREFMDRYRAPDSKRYKNWRSVFNKSVRGNWFKLWFVDSNGQYLLTTQGIQAQNTHKGKAA